MGNQKHRDIKAGNKELGLQYSKQKKIKNNNNIILKYCRFSQVLFIQSLLSLMTVKGRYLSGLRFKGI